MPCELKLPRIGLAQPLRFQLYLHIIMAYQECSFYRAL
jgi:hypothetical protein